MIQKLTRPCTVTSIDFNNTSAFKGISKHALLLIDNTRLEYLVTAVTTAVDGGYFKRCAVVLLLDSSVAANNNVLTRLNVRMRALWSASSPWSSPGTGSLTGPARGTSRPATWERLQLGLTRGSRGYPSCSATRRRDWWASIDLGAQSSMGLRRRSRLRSRSSPPRSPASM